MAERRQKDPLEGAAEATAVYDHYGKRWLPAASSVQDETVKKLQSILQVAFENAMVEEDTQRPYRELFHPARKALGLLFRLRLAKDGYENPRAVNGVSTIIHNAICVLFLSGRNPGRIPAPIDYSDDTIGLTVEILQKIPDSE